jgi:hypothetical protein
LTQYGADDQHFGVTADLIADIFPTPAVLAFDVELSRRDGRQSLDYEIEEKPCRS